MSASADVAMFNAEINSPAHQQPQAGSADEVVPESDDDMEGLFGDGEEEKATKEPTSRETSPTPSVLGGDGLTAAERRQRQALEYEEEERDAEPAMVREAQVPIPNIPLPHSSDGNYWIMRMPNFVKLDSQPFSPETYRGPEADLEGIDSAEVLRDRSMSIKLEVENTVRWRWVTGNDGQKMRQSNSRLIRWSDGSMSLQLGKEYFDVAANVDTSAATTRSGVAPTNSQSQSQSLPQSQTPSRAATPGVSKSHDGLGYDSTVISTPSIPHQGLSYLIAQHKSSAVLQVERPVTGFVSLRTTGLQSATHRKLVRAVGQKHSKVAKLRLAPETMMTQDPNAANAEALKAAKKRGRASAAAGLGASGSRSRRDVDEEDESEEEAYERERRRRRRTTAQSRDIAYSDDDDDEEPEAQESDVDDEDGSPRKKSSPKKSKKGKGPATGGAAKGEYDDTDGFVVEDPSDEDEEDGERPSAAHDEDEEEDDLDKMDRQIEDQEARNRKKASASSSSVRAAAADQDAEGDVDVEGEEEPESEMEMSDGQGASSRAKLPPPRAAAIPAGLDDDDDEEGGASGVPQAGRKPGKKRIILEDEDEE